MTTSTGNFAELLWPGIRVIWGNKYKEYSPLYTKFMESKNSDRAFEKEQGVTGLPLPGIKDQGSPIPFYDPQQGFQKEYVNITYALGATVTREMYDDDQYGYINSIPEMLARSMRQMEETISANVLNNAFSSSFLGADGVALLVTNHPLVGGGTFSNTPATAADLTQTALETAITDIMNFVDDQSLKFSAMPKTLVVPTASWAIAEKIMGTDRAVGSSDNDINPVRGKMTTVVNPYITDNDSWFLITDVPNGLRFYDRRAAEIVRENEFSTQNLQFVTTRRMVTGWTDPRGAYGSPGA